MKRSSLLAAALSLFLAFSSLNAASAASSPAVPIDTQKPGSPHPPLAADAAHSDGERWIYDDDMLASRQLAVNAAAPATAKNPAIPLQTRVIDWQWNARTSTPAKSAAPSASSPDRFALIALDRADIAGNHDALIFAVLSILSGLICFSRKQAPTA